jgi:hypothetical protein
MYNDIEIIAQKQSELFLNLPNCSNNKKYVDKKKLAEPIHLNIISYYYKITYTHSVFTSDVQIS